ncbi:FixH family protein [Candidatus Gracilibacteria bacterium]|nr:FixH family protein [Candidatus Gracilibacteria bacterium]
MNRSLTCLLIVLIGLLTGCGVAPAVVAQGDLRITLATEPATPLAGRDTVVTLGISQSGRPLEAAAVGLQRRMPGMEHASDQELVSAAALGDGRYQAQTSFTMGGRWELVVTITTQDGAAQAVIVPLEVDQPGTVAD